MSDVRMIPDDALKELAEILVEGFYKSPDVAKKGASVKKVAIESFQRMLIANKENVEISLRRFHDWMHKNKVGVDDYKKYRSFDSGGSEGHGEIDSGKDDSKSQ